jgi:TBC1 domain family protein 5
VLSSPSIPKTLQPDPFDLHRSRGTSGTSQHNLPVLKSTSDIVNRDASQVAQDPTLKIWDTGQIGHSVVPRAQPARGGHSKSESVSSGRPPWEHRTRFEVEKDLTEMKATMDILSKAVGHVLDVLLATPTSTAAVNEEQDSQRREALESLDYIREILANGGRGADSEAIDRERLFGETWIRHDRITREKMEQEQRDAERKEKEKTLSAIPSPPAPLRRAAAPDTLPRTPFNNQGAGRGTAVAHGRNDSPRRSMDSFSRPLPGNRGSPLGPPAAVGVLDSPLTSSARASRLVSAPWEHTPSGFSGSGLSSSEIALPRAVRKVSNPLTGKETTSTPSPEQPIDLRRDPLGVLP